VRQQDPDLYAATWTAPKYDNPRYSQIAKDYNELVPARLNEWLDKHPEISWIVWRSGNRPNTRKMLKQHGERFLGNYTYVDLFDLMGQVPDFPADVWRLVESKTIEPLGHVDRAEVTDPEGTAFGYDISEEAAKGWAEGVYNQGHLPGSGHIHMPYPFFFGQHAGQHGGGDIGRDDLPDMRRQPQRRRPRPAAELKNAIGHPQVADRALQALLIARHIGDGVGCVFLGDPIPETGLIGGGGHRVLLWIGLNHMRTRWKLRVFVEYIYVDA
jgi:hypothetical protein